MRLKQIQIYNFGQFSQETFDLPEGNLAAFFGGNEAGKSSVLQALDIVLRAKGLDKRRDGSVVWVAPQPELAKFEQDKEDARIAIENREDLTTDYIQINYHNAAAIFKALTEAKGIGGSNGGNGGNQNDNGFLSPRGRIVADEGLNGFLRFSWNVARNPAARKRVLAMRKTFKTNQQFISAVGFVAEKPHGENVT